MRVKKIAAVLTGIITFFSGIASISAADVDDIAKADSPLFSIMLSYTSSTITNFRISNGTGNRPCFGRRIRRQGDTNQDLQLHTKICRFK